MLKKSDKIEFLIVDEKLFFLNRFLSYGFFFVGILLMPLVIDNTSLGLIERLNLSPKYYVIVIFFIFLSWLLGLICRGLNFERGKLIKYGNLLTLKVKNQNELYYHTCCYEGNVELNIKKASSLINLLFHDLAIIAELKHFTKTEKYLIISPNRYFKSLFLKNRSRVLLNSAATSTTTPKKTSR